MDLRLPYWQRVLVMVVCICGIVWALSLQSSLATMSAALLFTSVGALVAFMFLHHIDRLARELDSLREEVAALKEQPASTESEPSTTKGEQS